MIITHQQIVVTVQEYSTFAFPDDYLTITQGTVSFETMQVPNTKVSTHVEYSTSNSAICKIEGTKTTAQITAIEAGTANVYAKLVANSTGVVQASAEMMVYVKEAPVNACYITASNTIYTVNKGKSQTLSASITGSGIVTSDQQNLKWSTSDTDIISIAGINSNGTVTGQSIYITANKSGEALITCSHEKAASNLQFYIVVPGSAEKAVTFNKSYITLTKGSSGSTLKATIENAESSNDYNDLIWTVSNSGQEEVCRVMGSGQNVTIYPVNVGEAEVMAQLPDSKSVAKCTVLVQAGKSFVLESTSATVQPFETKKVKYTVSPANANLTWTMNQTKDFFTYRDLGCDANGVGYVQIEGLKEGNGNLYCVTDGNAKGNLSVRVAWDYDFALKGMTTFCITPEEVAEVEFRVNPSYADIAVNSTSDAFNYNIVNNGDGTGKIILKPVEETPSNITINVTATNPNNGDELIGSKNITTQFKYNDNDFVPIVTFKSKSGNFSKFNSEENIITIGDGENIELETKLNIDKSSAIISDIKFVPKDTSAIISLTQQTEGKNKIIKLSNANDIVSYEYYINWAKKPVYYPNGKSGSYITLDSFKTDLEWCHYEYHYHWINFGDHDNYNDHWGLISKIYSNYTFSTRKDCHDVKYERWLLGATEDTPERLTIADSFYWGLIDNPEEKGKIYSEYDFKNIALYYCDHSKFVWRGSTNQKGNDSQQDRHDNLKNKISSNGILSETVSATYRITQNKDIINKIMLGYLEIYIRHFGKDFKTQFPVYYEVRNCKMNQN